MKKRCRKKLTLLEVMICLFILSMVGGLLSINAKDLLEKYQVKKEISQLKSLVEKGKSYAFSYDADVYLHIEKSKKKSAALVGYLSSEEPLVFERKLFSKPVYLNAISSVVFDGSDDVQTIKFSKSQDQLLPLIIITKNQKIQLCY